MSSIRINLTSLEFYLHFIYKCLLYLQFIYITFYLHLFIFNWRITALLFGIFLRAGNGHV